MAKVITFSRVFPSYHPRAGERTGFVEGLWQSLFNQDNEEFMPFVTDTGLKDAYDRFTGPHDFYPKNHTIRAGHRFKVGDWFSPRVWSGVPYKSKQIIIAPDMQVKKTWDVEVDECDVWAMGLPGTQIKYLDDKQSEDIAKNDGLTEQDLYFWFKRSKKPFIGQVICWDDKIVY